VAIKYGSIQPNDVHNLPAFSPSHARAPDSPEIALQIQRQK
jgi:hypothetical protein